MEDIMQTAQIIAIATPVFIIFFIGYVFGRIRGGMKTKKKFKKEIKLITDQLAAAKALINDQADQIAAGNSLIETLQSQTADQSSQPGKIKITAYQLQTSNSFNVDVVGESFHQDDIEYLTYEYDDEPCPAVLYPEPNNPHDKNAVSVYIDGVLVGHLGRDAAAVYRQSIGDTAGACSAKIFGGFELDNGRYANYGIKLNTNWPPKIIT